MNFFISLLFKFIAAILDLISTKISSVSSFHFTVKTLSVTSKETSSKFFLGLLAKLEVRDNGEEQTKAEITLPKDVMKKSKVYVLVKAYDENGIQICAKGKEVTNETNKVLIELPESTQTVKYKAFVWEGLANLKPVCAPLTKEF